MPVPNANPCECGSTDIHFVFDMTNELPDYICCDDCGRTCGGLPKRMRDRSIDEIKEWVLGELCVDGKTGRLTQKPY